jgi:hypothetical protein
MLRSVRLVEQFNAIERDLPEQWAAARLRLDVADDGRCDRAAALLGPANPGRRGKHIRLTAARRGAGTGPEAVRRLLKRLDQEGIAGDLALVGADEAAVEELRAHPRLSAVWDDAVAALPPDWSDLYGEVRLDSTDFLDRAALLLSPLNPARYGDPTGFRFRCARQFGYGTAPQVVARCFERCDEEGITGEVEILRALSDTVPVATQGPVWHVGGRTV